MTSRVNDTGGFNTWPPSNAPAQRSTDRLIAWGLLWIALMGWTLCGMLLLVPETVTWRHVAFAALLGIKSLALTIIATRLLRLVTTGRGRRRA